MQPLLSSWKSILMKLKDPTYNSYGIKGWAITKKKLDKEEQNWEGSHFPVPKHTKKLQYSKQSGTSIETRHTNATESPEINPWYIVKWLSTRMLRTFSGEQRGKAFISTHGSWKSDFLMQKNDAGCLPYTIHKK